MTKVVDEAAVMEALAAGGSLVRVTSSKAGASWYVGPDNVQIDASVAEAVALRPDVSCLDGPVGRMVWEYVLASRRDQALDARMQLRAAARADYDGEAVPARGRPAAEIA